MAYGITYSEFLNLNPKILYIYQSNHIEQMKQREIEKDNFAWLQGMYIANAIGSCFSKRSKYPSKPYSAKDLEETTLTDAERFNMWASAFNKNKGLEN